MKINRLNSKRILLLVIMALAVLMAAGTLTAIKPRTKSPKKIRAKIPM